MSRRSTSHLLRICPQCVRMRRPEQFVLFDPRCAPCRGADAKPNTRAARAHLQHARRAALRAMPYLTRCRKCSKYRPSSFYPWEIGVATKQQVCNACRRIAPPGRPRKPRFLKPKPMGPTARATAARRAARTAAQRDKRSLPAGLTSPRAARIARWLTAEGVPGTWTAHTVYTALRGHLSPREVWPACAL